MARTAMFRTTLRHWRFMTGRKAGSAALAAGLALWAGTAPAHAQISTTQLTGDVAPSGNAWVIGEVNWREDGWTPPGYSASEPQVSPVEPYGDVLGYTCAGVGDVDGNGYGDFAATWYDAEPRDETNGSAPGSLNWCDDEHVGFVRVVKGDADPMTHEHHPIGNDFWGRRNDALWSHEITTIGDIDGDGRDDLILSANSDRFEPSDELGVVEIWAFTDEYNLGMEGERWVPLIVIKGHSSGTRHEGFGYQAYHGPLPGPDFNNDGAPDLLLSSQWYHNQEHPGHEVNAFHYRQRAPGGAWIFMMPTSEVFENIKKNLGSATNNGQGLPDWLPLEIQSSEYNVRVHGHQIIPDMATAGTVGAAKHFGFDIDSAGDIDGDEDLDFLVTAPLHMDEEDYAAAVTNYPYSKMDPHHDFTNQVGRVYFFLSDSGRTDTDRAEQDPISALDPLYYPDEMSTGGFAKLDSMTFEDHQIQFSSADADYVLTGQVSHGGPDFDIYANSVEGGVFLYSDDTGLAVFNNDPADECVEVYHSVADLVSVASQPTTAWVELNGNSPDVEIAQESGYAVPRRVRIAGDWDGDMASDHELFVDVSGNSGDVGVFVYDIGASSATTEHFYEAADGLCSMPGSNNFEDSIDVSTYVQAWPVWNSYNEDGMDDPIIGARGFPVPVTQFPTAFMGGCPRADKYECWYPISDPGCTSWTNYYVAGGAVWHFHADPDP